VPKSAEEIQRISPDDLKKLIEGNADIVVVDNQPKGAYDMGRVKGAINLPWDMQIKSAGNLPKDKLLVLYCACTHEEDASDVAMQLITKFDYTKIMLLDGGWMKWVELGYPQEKGAQ
jgi:rhodanese-related sulfurtransferase